MVYSRRRFMRLSASALTVLASSHIARAQSYPERPVRLIIGFPAGSSVDTVARILSDRLSARLGQSIVVESKPGAATNLSIEAAIASPPDGYTLVFVTSSTAINATFFDNSPFNFQRDLTPVAGFVTFPMVVVASPSFPARSVAEVITLAKASPGQVRFASFGTGTTSHLAGELFKAMAGVDLVHVPYRGSPAAHVDLISGQVQIMFDTLTGSLPLIRSGKLRALAVTGKSRFDALPDVPTLAETLPGFEASAWAGIAAPRGTPSEIVNLLNREITASLEDPIVNAHLADVAAVPLPFSPAGFGAYVAAETEKWGKVVKISGAKAE
jgi:tripartite-type tricarboxylate transporter receptor subunit TctC